MIAQRDMTGISSDAQLLQRGGLLLLADLLLLSCP